MRHQRWVNTERERRSAEEDRMVVALCEHSTPETQIAAAAEANGDRVVFMTMDG
jgi:hypothetical protein